MTNCITPRECGRDSKAGCFICCDLPDSPDDDQDNDEEASER